MRTNLRFFNVVLVGVLVLTALLGSTTTPAKAIDEPITVFINEIHYDNVEYRCQRSDRSCWTCGN